ncbi:MAG: nucleotidyl transferase AbiEii/AbiGii toxin family protein [Gemmatimonadetes bacterium]|nr:nucleotidyl transferase AbiEii/AbiGii toxin family protein [Gemmatimonadota bacterium]MYG34869.1 nucleotidyl transferase AbiEii/AbiGii toxin family protein [Gemmatimonadota bacterium]MYJ16832.1 nucleotidyl transferase AbiEii/AbiGii toxin family protein [Gemmatimonadota bacterium]
MKDHVRSLVRGLDPLVGRNVLREYIQARILEGLQRAGAMSPLAFQGGTALRLLYGLRRYSEDLDFALEGPRELYDLRGWMRAIVRQFRREGYEAEASVRDRGNVHTGWIRVRGALFETGLSPHREETLGVKVDVDTHPPAGAVTATRLVRRHVSLRLHHHDRASLLAGKLHAVLCRPWTKGRDIYDLAWYLSDPTWPSPNLELLNAAIRQSDAEAVPLDACTWPGVVAARVEGLSWETVVADVRPFLEGDEEMVGKGDVLGLLEARGG